MIKKKPVNLNLTSIRFPITAIVSILHRLSGLLLFFFIPLVLWLLNSSLVNEASFIQLSDGFTHPFAKFILWALWSAIIYHMMAGFRHLLMDVGIGETRKTSIFSAYLLMAVTIALITLIGIWLW